MLSLRTLFHEVHRRGLWQAAAAFLGMGWAVLEVMDLFTGRGLLPDWTFTGALVVLALGLPVVLATAYVQTPARDSDSRLGESGADPSTDPVNSGEVGSPDRGWLGGVLTWRRAALGGVVAFAVLGFIAAGFGVMRVTGIGAPGTLLAQGIIEEGGLVILADFQSSAGSEAPSDLVTEALRIDLEQSPTFDLMDPRAVVAGLARMVRDPEGLFSEDVALDLAVREGAELVVSGEVGDIGGSYLVTGRILSAADGSVLAGFRETARDSDGLIDAIDALSAKIRSKMGEALLSVASTDPLSQATTTSVEALRKFTYVAQREPRGAISGPQAKEIIQEALVLDTTFAEAYRYLSILITNFGGSMQQRADAAAKAYAFRDRLSPKKRLLVAANYHLTVTGEFAQAARAYESLLELDPLYRVAAINLADVAMYDGDYAWAEELLREGSRPDSYIWVWNMMASLAGQKKYAEAEAMLDGAVEALPDNVFLAPTRAFFFANVGRQKKALFELEAGEPYAEEIAAWPLFIEAGILARQGKLIQAGQQLALADQLLLEIATPPEYIGSGAVGPFISGFMAGDGPRGMAEMQEMLSRVTASEVEPVDRLHGLVALSLGLMGEAEGAREYVARYDAEVPSLGDPGGRADKDVAQALSQILDGGSVVSSGLVEAARFVRCARCRYLYLGVGYEFSGDLENAASSYQAFLDDGFFDASLTVLFFPEPVIHERLAGIYDALGQPEEAVEHYRKFASQWAESDPGLLPRVERALERASALADGAS